MVEECLSDDLFRYCYTYIDAVLQLEVVVVCSEGPPWRERSEAYVGVPVAEIVGSAAFYRESVEIDLGISVRDLDKVVRHRRDHKFACQVQRWGRPVWGKLHYIVGCIYLV